MLRCGLLLLLCTPALVQSRGSDLSGCGIPPDSPFSAADCECIEKSTDPTTCNGQVGTELVCRNLDELFVDDDAVYSSVTCLNITRSSFGSLTSAHTRQFPNLNVLHIKDSELSEVRGGALDVLTGLRFLNLTNNRLTIFPRINLTSSGQEIAISLRSNLIQSLDQGRFRTLPRLVALDLAGNNIMELEDNIFETNCRLRSLILSGNPLKTISSEAFTGASIEHLTLRSTEISELPTSQDFREQIRSLHLDKSYNFKEFSAYMDEERDNATFPFLKTVSFPYHAHCCQLNQSGFVFRDRFVSTSDPINDTTAPPTTDPRLPYDVVECVNITSQQCLNVSEVDLSDTSSITFVNSTLEYCDSCTPCLQASPLCSEHCADSATMMPGSGDASDSVMCLVRTSISVNITLCNNTVVEENEIADCGGVLMGDIPIVVPTRPPCIPIVPQDDGYCFQLDSSVVGACLGCSTSCLNGDTDPAGCGVDDFGDFCSCVRHPDQPKCRCEEEGQGRRRRRDASYLAPYQDEWAGSPDEPRARGRRDVATPTAVNMTANVPCGDENNTTFFAELNGFTGPALCTRRPRRFVLPTTAPSINNIACPTRILLSDTVEMGPPDCSPGDDPFNPCTDLLGETDHLRIAIWFVIVIALVGNLMVFIIFIGYSVIVRKAKQEIFVVHFLYFNLALSDFLMGVYLLIIASEDIATKGRFYETDISWRTGHTCEFAGFCAIVSTVMSVYVLLVITLERTYTIVRVLSHKKLTKLRAMVLMAIGWVMALIIAALPLFYFSDYNSVAICLPFQTEEPQDLAYVVILLLATGLSFIVIAVCYAIILQQILCSRRKSSPYQEARKRLRGEIRVAIRIFILVFTNIGCWFPIALVGLSAAFGKSLVSDLEFARWAIVFIFPINACLNPILYSFTTRAFRENFILLFNKCGLFRGRAQTIRNAQAGISVSRVSDTSGMDRVRSTVIMRFRSLSISSQTSMMDLLGKRNHRRSSTFSQNSEDSVQTALSSAKRRSSTFSNDSNKEPSNLKMACSDSTFFAESDEALMNPGFRTNSPDAVLKPPTIFDRPGNEALRARCKVSASSLGAVPEENEIAMELIGDQTMVKVNPAFVEDEMEEGVGSEEGTGSSEEGVTRWERGDDTQRDSGCAECSENDDGSAEVSVEVNPVSYQLQTHDNPSPT